MTPPQPPEPDALPVAVRVWTERTCPSPPTAPPRAAPRWPDLAPDGCPYVLVFDTETTTDAAQTLNFGVWCVALWRPTDAGPRLLPLQEGLFYADDLAARDAAGYATLRAYATEHGFRSYPTRAAVWRALDRAADYSRALPLADWTALELPFRAVLTRTQFVEWVFYPLAARRQGLVVGFNLPFDLSRLAVHWGPARRVPDAFSFALSTYAPGAGPPRPHPYRPRIRIQHVDNKRAFLAFTRPKGSGPSGRRGHFLDLRTLAYALTGRSHSLASAAAAFQTPHQKANPTGAHGQITPAYLAYARQDVQVTADLLVALRAEFDRHPLPLPATRAYSPASLGKAYLQALGIRPRLTHQPAFPRTVLGYATAAFYGGRAECRIRRVPVPVVYVDFLAMYPTVNALMDNWALLTADHLTVEDATPAVRRFLAQVTPDHLLDLATWRALAVLVQVHPQGDRLPVRAAYRGPAAPYEIGLNPYWADAPAWYTLADCVASTLLTGRPPTVCQALRLVPHGRQPTLQLVAFGGAVPLDPGTQDFFRVAVEERYRLKQRANLTPTDGERLALALKILANAASYGIFAELNRTDRAHPTPVTVWGPDDAPFETLVPHPEDPGPYAFPPLAAFITGGARLMLALLERGVADLGGTFAFCDTDSLAIVSTPQGGLVPCPGGPARTPDGAPAVRALPWHAVDALIARFAALNPYDPAAVPGSILKLEAENFDAQGRQVPLYCYAISAKRYALFHRDGDRITLRKASEHGLGGVYLDPTPGSPDADLDEAADPDAADADPAAASVARPFIHAFWQHTVETALGLPTPPLPWRARPALSRLTVSTPALLRPFAPGNRGRPPSQQVRPFNFVLLAHPAPPLPEPRPSPVAPYTADPAQWPRLPWTDRHTGARVRLALPDARDAGLATTAVRIQTFETVLTRYAHHPEAKSRDAQGRSDRSQGAGWLAPRPVRAATRDLIGKETPRLDHPALDLVPDRDAGPTRYEAARCAACGTPFPPRTRRQRYCRRACQKRAARARHAADAIQTPAGRPPNGGEACASGRARAGQAAPRPCPGCDAAFTPRTRRQHYCSPACRLRAYRQRQAAGGIRPPAGPPPNAPPPRAQARGGHPASTRRPGTRSRPTATATGRPRPPVPLARAQGPPGPRRDLRIVSHPPNTCPNRNQMCNWVTERFPGLAGRFTGVHDALA